MIFEVYSAEQCDPDGGRGGAARRPAPARVGRAGGKGRAIWQCHGVSISTLVWF